MSTSHHTSILLALLYLFLFVACQKNTAPDDPDDSFFERMDAAHDGDYLATYPLSDPDSCIARLKAEVPEKHQPWSCLSIWYRLPRTDPSVNFRLLKLYEENYPHDTVFAFTQMMRGEFYVSLAQFDSARICLEDAKERYTRLGRILDASDATYLMARSHTYQYRFADALESYFEVLDLLNEHDTAFTHRRAYLYYDISVAYERSGNKAQQFQWLQKMWASDHSKLDYPGRYKRSLAHSFGLHYLDIDPDSSLMWAKKAIEIEETQLNISPPSPRLLYVLARAYYKKGDCATALPLFKDAHSRNKNKQEAFSYYQYGQAVGGTYLCLGQLDSAEVYLKWALSTPDTGNLAAIHKMLSEVYEKRGEWKSALSEAWESRKLYENHFKSEKMKTVAELEARYENAQKENLIARLEEEQRNIRQKGLIIGLSLLMAIGLMGGLFFRQRGYRRILEQEKQLLEQGIKLAEAEAQLKNQELERANSQLMESMDTLQTTREKLDSTTSALDIKNQLVKELRLRLEQSGLSHEQRDISSQVKNENVFRMKILNEEDWALFRGKFEKYFPGLQRKLKMEFPDLTTAELRLFLLLKLNFSNREIAESLGISPASIVRSRHRLRNKLGFVDNPEMDRFILHFE